jgi:hypothetical protein
MPGIHSYSLAMLRMAYESQTRAASVAAAAADGSADDALVAVILSASAAEGFVNDLAGTIQFGVDALATSSYLGPSTGDIPRLTAITSALEFMEEERSRTQAKYLAAAVLTGCARIRNGREPFKSLDDLFVLRNGIVHVKPIDPDARNRQGKVVESLAQRGIARPAAPRVASAVTVDTWWTQIRTPQVALWAAESARQAMLVLAESLVAVGDVAGFVTGAINFLQLMAPKNP